jgi:hypothetical protein
MLLLAGCAKEPTEQMNAAKAALDNVKAVEADRYVPEEYSALQDSLNAALAMIEQQNSKFALTRNYDKAKKALDDVVTMSDQTRQNAVTSKDETRTEVQQTLAEVNAALQESKDLIAAAPKGKEGRAALAEIQNELTVVESSMNEVTVLINNGDYLTARDKANAGLTKVQSLNDELKGAIAKKSAISHKKAS